MCELLESYATYALDTCTIKALFFLEGVNVHNDVILKITQDISERSDAKDAWKPNMSQTTKYAIQILC
ncbi:hypothetical protein CTI12_AA010290 [Artemisia annua]|uniref:Uncharacterized protein n=1 Tax=Artemisia annua TaxID=35608 RepID=A0A2U1QMT7_ARTAN|nr:hypothetical protein CTI12_AA010290 [Artemisia annua]